MSEITTKRNYDPVMLGMRIPARTVYAEFADGSREDIAISDTLDLSEAKELYDVWSRHKAVERIVLCDKSGKPMVTFSRDVLESAG